MKNRIVAVLLMAINLAHAAQESTAVAETLQKLNETKPKIVRELDQVIKMRRGCIDTTTNNIGAAFEMNAFDAATGALLMREQTVIEEAALSALAAKVSFASCLNSLKHEQLLLLCNAEPSWKQNKAFVVREKLHYAIMRTLPETLQHESLFDVR